MNCYLEKNEFLNFDKNYKPKSIIKSVIGLIDQLAYFKDEIEIDASVLLLSENLSFFPFEYLPFFDKNSYFFYRIPSLTYILQINGKMNYNPEKIKQNKNFNSAYYVINPSGDLMET